MTDPKLLRKSQKVAKHILEIAEETLKKRRTDPRIQELCVKNSLQIISDHQDRVDPKKNLNVNANLNLDTSDFIAWSMYRYRGDRGAGKGDAHPL